MDDIELLLLVFIIKREFTCQWDDQTKCFIIVLIMRKFKIIYNESCSMIIETSLKVIVFIQWMLLVKTCMCLEELMSEDMLKIIYENLILEN